MSAISQTPWNTGTLSKSCLADCILVGLSGKVSVSSSELELAILGAREGGMEVRGEGDYSLHGHHQNDLHEESKTDKAPRQG